MLSSGGHLNEGVGALWVGAWVRVGMWSMGGWVLRASASYAQNVQQLPSALSPDTPNYPPPLC